MKKKAIVLVSLVLVLTITLGLVQSVQAAPSAPDWVCHYVTVQPNGDGTWNVHVVASANWYRIVNDAGAVVAGPQTSPDFVLTSPGSYQAQVADQNGGPWTSGNCYFTLVASTPTPTCTPSPTPTVTPTVTPSVTFTLTPSVTVTLTFTPSPTVKVTRTPTPTATETDTPTSTGSVTPSATPTQTPTLTATTPVTNTVTPEITDTPTVTVTPQLTETPGVTPSLTTTLTPGKSRPVECIIMQTTDDGNHAVVKSFPEAKWFEVWRLVAGQRVDLVASGTTTGNGWSDAFYIGDALATGQGIIKAFIGKNAQVSSPNCEIPLAPVAGTGSAENPIPWGWILIGVVVLLVAWQLVGRRASFSKSPVSKD